MPLNNIQIGPQNVADGAPNIVARGGRQGDQIVSELHGRYYEQNVRGNVFMGGMALTAITAATFGTGDLTATAKPITGVYNPVSSGVNLVIIQAYLGVTITAATCTGGGPYVWAGSAGPNEVLTLGTVPTNAKTLSKTSPSGASSVAKDMSGIALTGLVTTLTIKRASSLCGGSSASFSFVGTAVGQATAQVTSVENFDGLFIVPPGCVIGLFQTTTAVAHSAVSGIVWEEVPI